VMRGMDFQKTMNRDANLKARHFLEEAIALDPEYQTAYSALANTYLREIWLGPSKDKKKTWGRAMELTTKAISLDESYAAPYTNLALLLAMARQYDKAIAAAERAIALDPANPELYAIVGNCFNYTGRRDEAIELFEKALRRDPFPSAFVLLWAGLAYRDAGRYDDAVRLCGAAVEQQADFIFGHTCLASAYNLAGRKAEAQAAAAEVLRINPKFSVEALKRALPYKDPADIARILSSLKKAGLPD